MQEMHLLVGCNQIKFVNGFWRTKPFDLKTMFDQARALDSAMRSSETFSVPQPFNAAAVLPETTSQEPSQSGSNPSASTLATSDPKCFFCGSAKHSRAECPARDAVCRSCQKKGHYAKVCRGENAKARQILCCPRATETRLSGDSGSS